MGEKRKLTTMEMARERRRKRRALNQPASQVNRKPLTLRAPLNTEERKPIGPSLLSRGGVAAASTVINLKESTSFILPKDHYDKVMQEGIREFTRAVNSHGLYPRCKLLGFTFKEPPLDWGLKTHLMCTSKNSFEWARMISSLKQAEALTAFLSNQIVDLASPEIDPGFGLYYSLLHWRFPDVPKDFNLFKEFESVVYKKENKRTPVEKAMVREQNDKREAWQQAFHSLYHSYRSGNCPHFFYKTEWCFALFLSGGQDEKTKRTQVVVILTGVSRSFRDQLRSSGVAFSTPLYQQKQQKRKAKPVKINKIDDSAGDKMFVAENEHLDAVAECEALREYHNVTIRLPTRESDAEAAATSVLQVEGRYAVHCLYDFIINYAPRLHDVPLILSPSPFLNATCKSALITSVTEGSMAGSGEKTNILEIKGCIPPFTILRLCHLLDRTQEEGFELKIRGDEQCQGVNCLACVKALSGPVLGHACEVVALREEFKESPNNLLAGLERIKRSSKGEFSISLARTYSGIS